MDLLLPRIEKTQTCWLWTGGRFNDGYGSVWYEGKSMGVHRLTYLLNKGSIPEGHVIRHACNTPLCVNPEHLEVGTHQDNINDKVRANRQAKGGEHGRAKLTPEQAKEIRCSPLSNPVLGKLYGVDRRTCYAIKKGVVWREQK